jgi:signal transduction histidine kinase
MALALSLGFLLLFGAFSALGEYALRESANETRHQYLVIARLTAAELDARISQEQADLRQTGDDLSAATGDAGEQEALALGFRRMDSMALDILFVDTSGVTLAAAPNPVGTLDPGLVSFAEHAAAGDPATASDPFSDPRTGRPAVALATRVTREGQPVGVILGILALDSQPVLQALSQAVQVGRTGHAGLLDAQGRVLVSTYGLAFLSAGEHPPFFQEAMAARKDEVKTVPFVLHLPGETTGEQHLMAAAMLHQVPWGVDVGGDASEAFAPSSHLRWGLAIIGTLSLIAIWGGSLWGTRVLVRPVYGLMRSAQSIADGDLDLPLEASAGGEIGAMARALDQMRQRLLQTIQSLEDLRATLEVRVQERTAALHEQEAQVRRLLHQVITAQEEERARLAYELHDEIGQLLTAVRFSTDDLPIASLDADAARRVLRAQELIDEAMNDLRRLISGLRPGVLDQLGLMAALREVADRILTPAGVVVAIDGPQDRLPPEVEVVLFRIAQEAMHNVARHSGATRVEVTVTRSDGDVTMRISDDGRGFDVATAGLSAAGGRGLGLAGMHERAALLGGALTINSTPGTGTTAEVWLPLPPHGDDGATIGDGA